MAATGGVAPTPPKRPTVIRPASSAGHSSPSRPVPPVPIRTGKENITEKHDEQNKLMPPPPPARPRERSREISGNAVTEPTQNNSPTMGKRRPEITIVSARPMSEVGFRDTQTASNMQPKAAPIQPPSKLQESTIVNRVPPPRPTIVKHNAPVIPQKPHTEHTEFEHGRAPPPIPMHPTSPRLRSRSGGIEPPHSSAEQQGPPVPVPRSAIVKTEQETPSSDSVKYELDKCGKDLNVSEPLYSVINKPKRPTVIRPNRPGVTDKNPSQQNTQNEEKVEESQSPSVINKDEQDSTDSNSMLRARKSFFESKQEEAFRPEFLTKKLKPTIPSESENNENHRIPTTLSQNKPPPPPAKLKPTIVPKPQIAAKPKVALKPTIQTTDSKVKQDEESSKETHSSNSISTGVKAAIVDFSKQTPVKRPTIIRPSRKVQSYSTENVNNLDQSEESPENTSSKFQSSDDNLNRVQSRPQPPLPTKRPVSLINIPDAIAHEEKRLSVESGSQFYISNSSENINKMQSSPSPTPRPKARPRPMSMMIPSSARPPLPSAGPKIEDKGKISLSPPSRPRQRPAMTGDNEKAPTFANRMSTIGIAVLPGVKKNEANNKDHSESIKQTQVAQISPEIEGRESSEEEEFFTAPTKPDRPSGPPLPRPRLPSKDPPIGSLHSSVENKAPPRPTGAPEHLKKAFITGDKDETIKDSKTKPSRPDSKPARPESVPVTMEQPARPHPPRPGGPQAKQNKGNGLPPRPGQDHPLYRYMMKAPHGIALFDYNARQDDELNFKKDDVIVLVKELDSDWLVGQIGDKEGMFPKSFVKVKMPLQGQDFDVDSSDDEEEMFFETTEKPDHIGTGPRCRARFDFDGEGAGDLPFEEGDIIKLLDRVGNEWRKGECNGKIGVFPLVFVDVIEDLPEERPAETKSTTVTAMFDFEGEADDLSFQAGEKIHVMYAVSEDWLFGEIDSRKGQFPVQFVDHVPSDLTWMPNKDKPEEKHSDPLTASLAMWDAVDDDDQSLPSSQEKISKSTKEHVTKETFDHGEEKSYCIAVYDYPGETAEDLKFSTGDRIDIVERVNDDWLKGSCHGLFGIFPSAFVEIKVDTLGTDSGLSSWNSPVSESHTSDHTPTEFPTSDTPVHSTHTEIGVAQYDFMGEADNELTFKSGDRIELHDFVPGAEDWRYGVLDGKQGIFPAAFVS